MSHYRYPLGNWFSQSWPINPHFGGISAISHASIGCNSGSLRLLHGMRPDPPEEHESQVGEIQEKRHPKHCDTPRTNHSLSKHSTGDRSHCCLQIQKIISDCRAVTTVNWMAPRHNRSVCQDRSKCADWGLNLLHAPQLISDCKAVTTVCSMAARRNRSVCQDRSKCADWGLNLLHAPQLISDCRAVTTLSWMAPRHIRSVCQDPADAAVEAWICCTLLSWSRTAELSPP